MTGRPSLVVILSNILDRWMAEHRAAQAAGVSAATVTRDSNLLAGWKSEDLIVMPELFEAGTVRPIDRCYPLGEAAEALRRVGE